MVEKFLLFTLVLTRLAGLMMTAPVFGARFVPMQIRGFLAFAMALLIMPAQWHCRLAYPGSMLGYLVLVAAEVLIGACLGIGLEVLFSGMYLAGQLVGRVSGEMLAEVYDPASDENVAVFSQLFWMAGLATFVCVGGHRAVMAGLLDTFATVPPGSLVAPDSLADVFLRLLTQSFSLGIRAAAPAVAALLLATLVVALVSRTLPQLNTLALGFSINSLVTYTVLGVSIGAAVWVFQAEVEGTVDALLGALWTSVRGGLIR